MAGVTHGELTLNGTSTGSVLTGDSTILFAKTGAITGNTALTLSTAGANLDSLAVGGAISCTGNLNGIGPNPVQLTLTPSSTQTVVPNVVTVFTASPAFPIVAGVYDIQFTGYWTIGAGVITPGVEDYAQVLVSVQPGTFPGAYVSTGLDYLYPANVNNPWKQNTTQPFAVRQRVVSSAPVANVEINADLVSLGPGVYPTINLTLVYVSITRVA